MEGLWSEIIQEFLIPVSGLANSNDQRKQTGNVKNEARRM